MVSGPSNFRSKEDLDTFLFANGVVGLMGYRHARAGENHPRARVMNAAISDDPDFGRQAMERLRAYRVEQAVETRDAAMNRYAVCRAQKRRESLVGLRGKAKHRARSFI
jgi:hypothetical protein